MTDQARKLFAILVKEVWEKHPELRPSGVTLNRDAAHPYIYEGSSYDAESLPDVVVEATAAKCAEWIQRWDSECRYRPLSCGSQDTPWGVWTSETEHDVGPAESYHACWLSAHIAAVLSELGIEYEGRTNEH